MIRIRTTQYIDYWVGVPLCGISTAFLKFVGIFRSKSQKPVRKVLFIELSEMGSTILADPAMNLIKRQNNAQLYFVIFTHNRPSLELLNTVPIQNVFTIRATKISHLIVDTFRFLIWTRKNQIDTVIDLELFSRFTALLSGFCGASRRVGFYSFYNEGLYRGEMLTHRVAFNPHIHVSKNFMALAHAAVSDRQDHPFGKIHIADHEISVPKLSFTEEQKAMMLAKIQVLAPEFSASRNRIVLLNPNASDFLPLRRWMAEHFASVATQLLEKFPDVFVLITGAPQERPEAGLLCQKIGSSRCINFAGQTQFKDLPLLYEVSELMLTNDSGPAHFAAVTRMPTYVIFGPETPKLYGSLGKTFPITAEFACSPCVAATNHRRSPCTDNQCLKAITPHRVFTQIAQALSAGNSAR